MHMDYWLQEGSVRKLQSGATITSNSSFIAFFPLFLYYMWWLRTQFLTFANSSEIELPHGIKELYHQGLRD